MKKIFLAYLVLSLAALFFECGGGEKKASSDDRTAGEASVALAGQARTGQDSALARQDDAASRKPDKADQQKDISFSADVQPVLDASCASRCHGERAAGGLVLSGPGSYKALAGAASRMEPPLLLVAPGAPDSSYLVMKLEGTHKKGKAMPIGDSLDPAVIEAIKAWIAAGAREN
jgi:hypothetical protein